MSLSDKEDSETMLEEFRDVMLQRMIVIAQIPQHVVDRTELGAHYEKLNLQFSRQVWNHVTGLLLIYPSCVLHIIESSREVLFSLLRDFQDMQEQPDCSLLESPKVMFVVYNPQSRMFLQWSYKELSTDQGPVDSVAIEEEESVETLVCTVLSALQKLGELHKRSTKPLPGSVLDETPELIVSQAVLSKLLARDDLLTPQQYLQLYSSPLNISMDFRQAVRSSSINTV